MVISYAFASVQTCWPGVGMAAPTCTKPKEACSIPQRGSFVEHLQGQGSRVSFAVISPPVWKESPTCTVSCAAQSSKDVSVLRFGLVNPTYNLKSGRGRHACRGAVEIGGAQTIQEQKMEVKKGCRVKVKGPLKVFHIPKVPEFDLDGLEGEVKDVLREWKGKSISANLPYKVQFFAQIDAREVKFVAHFKDGEIEVVD